MKRFPALKTASLAALAFIMMWIAGRCSKEYSLESDSLRGASGTWEFTEGGQHFQGTVDSVYILKGVSISELHIKGYHKTTLQRFHLMMYADTFLPGNYKASTFQAAFDYGDDLNPEYTAGQTTGEFVVKIVSINKEIVTGSFSGKALNDSGDVVDISDGLFRALLPKQQQVPRSEGVLGSDAGNCSPLSVEGVYKQGVALTAQNIIQVEVTVNEPGSYHIFTEPVNGVQFSATGEFDNRGKHTVKLNGSGTPAFGGDQSLVVKYGNSMCAFILKFATAAEAPNDYFPTTFQTYWKYKNETFYNQVTNKTSMVDGKKFIVIGKYQNLTDANYDTVFRVRKDAGNYYGVVDFSEYTGSPTPQLAETIFLKDNLPNGTWWNSPEITYATGGTTVRFYVRYTIIEKEVAANVGTFTFPDVIKVKAEVFAEGVFTGMTEEYWYAFNVGLVYSKDFLGNEREISEYSVQPI